MPKNERRKWDTRTIVFLALLVAMQIVLARLVVIDVGFCRITISSICTICAGLWFGPVAGGICGMTADLLGCFIKGYAVNPLITLSAILWGVIPGLLYVKMTGSKLRKTVVLCVAIVLSSILGTLVFTTAGLVWMNGYNFYAIMPARLTQWAVMTPVYCVLSCGLYFSPLTSLVMNATTGRRAAHV